MNKDVIYIDVEDDVTAIIGKIKASKEKIIALPENSGIVIKNGEIKNIGKVFIFK